MESRHAATVHNSRMQKRMEGEQGRTINSSNSSTSNNQYEDMNAPRNALFLLKLPSARLIQSSGQQCNLSS